MAENNAQRGNIYSANDPLDINELASLNNDITPEFIEQLQNQIEQNAGSFIENSLNKSKVDSELFEEINLSNKEEIEDNITNSAIEDVPSIEPVEFESKDISSAEVEADIALLNQEIKQINKNFEEIETLTGGNIVEKPITQDEINYSNSLNYLDDNTKYSKYVIYISPENKEFIDSLTVKERKNLINRILKEQDDIIINKKRLNLFNAIFKHLVIAIITISITVPVVYWIINASLEATVNNYRHSQTVFKTLYKEKGKIRSQINN